MASIFESNDIINLIDDDEDKEGGIDKEKKPLGYVEKSIIL